MPTELNTSARPAEAAIAKVFAEVFAKIGQKILFCKFFGRAGRTGTSRTTSCQNFSLERPLAVPQTSKKRKKQFGNFYGFGTQFFVILTDFGGARLFLMSKSSSSRFFALDGQIFRSVRRLELILGFFTVHTSTCGEIYGEGPVAPTPFQVCNSSSSRAHLRAYS